MSIKLDKLKEILGDGVDAEKMEAIMLADEADIDVSEYEAKIADLSGQLETARADYEERVKALWFGKSEVSEPEIEAKGVEAEDEAVEIKDIADIIDETL